MKNIFLKETDQESELYYNTHTNVYGHSKNVLSMGGWVVNQFIYITSDERNYKYGDYVFYIITNSIIEVTKTTAGLFKWRGDDPNDFKKIILTNDPSLIEDGVQEVNSSFLSFYAENTPDYVEVEKWLDDEGKRFYSLDFSPKKELKTEENIIDNWLENNGNPEIMKKVEREAEELELQYYAENFSKNHSIYDSAKDDTEYGFINGAKWQAERMYSEEEVVALIHRFNYDLVNSNIETFKEWFDEHKKQ